MIISIHFQPVVKLMQKICVSLVHIAMSPKAMLWKVQTQKPERLSVFSIRVLMPGKNTFVGARTGNKSSGERQLAERRLLL